MFVGGSAVATLVALQFLRLWRHVRCIFAAALRGAQAVVAGPALCGAPGSAFACPWEPTAAVSCWSFGKQRLWQARAPVLSLSPGVCVRTDNRGEFIEALVLRCERPFSACNRVISFCTLWMCCRSESRTCTIWSQPSPMASVTIASAATSGFTSASTETALELFPRCAIE